MLIFDEGDITVHSLDLGPLRTNCFIVQTPEFSFVIDPVGESEKIISYLTDNDIEVEFCMATHGHFDHVGAAFDLIESNICDKLYIHEEDEVELKRCNTYSMLLDKKPFARPRAENIRWFDDELIARLDSVGFTYKHLPSHTQGSSIIFTQDCNLLFSGDIILRHPKARNNRCKVGESREGLEQAFVEIHQMFRADTILFPGHGKMMRLDSEYAMQKEFREN